MHVVSEKKFKCLFLNDNNGAARSLHLWEEPCNSCNNPVRGLRISSNFNSTHEVLLPWLSQNSYSVGRFCTLEDKIDTYFIML